MLVWIFGLFMGLFGRSKQPIPPRARPHVEILEDRWVPATRTWTGWFSEDWFWPLNWAELAVPTANDDVVLTRPVNKSPIISPPGAGQPNEVVVNSLTADANFDGYILALGRNLRVMGSGTWNAGYIQLFDRSLIIDGATFTFKGGSIGDGLFGLFQNNSVDVVGGGTLKFWDNSTSSSVDIFVGTPFQNGYMNIEFMSNGNNLKLFDNASVYVVGPRSTLALNQKGHNVASTGGIVVGDNSTECAIYNAASVIRSAKDALTVEVKVPILQNVTTASGLTVGTGSKLDIVVPANNIAVVLDAGMLTLWPGSTLRATGLGIVASPARSRDVTITVKSTEANTVATVRGNIDMWGGRLIIGDNKNNMATLVVEGNLKLQQLVTVEMTVQGTGLPGGVGPMALFRGNDRIEVNNGDFGIGINCKLKVETTLARPTFGGWQLIKVTGGNLLNGGGWGDFATFEWTGFAPPGGYSTVLDPVNDEYWIQV